MLPVHVVYLDACACSVLLARPYVLSMRYAAQLVELQDADPHALPAGKATADLYKCASAQRAVSLSAASPCLLI